MHLIRRSDPAAHVPRTIARWTWLPVGVAAVSALHYVTPPEHFVLHAIYERLHSVPVVLSA